MHLSSIASVFLTALFTCVSAQTTTNPVTGILGNATVVENNLQGPIYVATLPEQQFFDPNSPNINGSVSATANPNGIGVSFQVSLSNLPTDGGPFVYHLHAFPVPTDGNCNGTLGHLDPFIRGEVPSCDENLPQTCQVGDLAGKHGKITSDPFIASYSDDFASTVGGLGSFFGNRSLVIHFANKTRITCANFTLLGDSVGAAVSSSGGNTSSGAAQVTANPTGSSFPAEFTGVAVTFVATPVLYILLIGVLALTL